MRVIVGETVFTIRHVAMVEPNVYCNNLVYRPQMETAAPGAVQIEGVPVGAAD